MTENKICINGSTGKEAYIVYSEDNELYIIHNNEKAYYDHETGTFKNEDFESVEYNEFSDDFITEEIAKQNFDYEDE